MSDENDKAAQEAAAKEAAEAKAAEEAAAAEAAKKAEADKNRTVPHEAMHAEREKRKAAEAEIERLKKEQADKEAAEAAKRGEFENLYNEEKTKREGLETTLKEKDEKLGAFEAKAQANIEKMLGQVTKDEDRKTVETLLDGKSLEQKETLLPTLLEKFGVANNVNATPSGAGNEKTQSDAATDKEIEKLKEQKAEAIKNNKTSDLFKLNRRIRELEASRA